MSTELETAERTVELSARQLSEKSSVASEVFQIGAKHLLDVLRGKTPKRVKLILQNGVPVSASPSNDDNR